MQRLRRLGNAANVADKTMALAPDQIYKLGTEALGWNNSTANGKALMAEDLKLLKGTTKNYRRTEGSNRQDLFIA